MPGAFGVAKDFRETHGEAAFENLAHAAFADADTDGNGHLDMSELRQTLKKLGIHMTGQTSAVFAQYDADGNGQIDRAEFCKLCSDLIDGTFEQQVQPELEARQKRQLQQIAERAVQQQQQQAGGNAAAGGGAAAASKLQQVAAAAAAAEQQDQSTPRSGMGAAPAPEPPPAPSLLQLSPVEQALHAEIGKLRLALDEQLAHSAKLEKRTAYLERKMQDLWLAHKTAARKEEIEFAQKMARNRARGVP